MVFEVKEGPISPGWGMTEGIPALVVLDLEGKARDLAWLNAMWGVDLDIRRVDPIGSAEYVLRLVQLRVHEGPCAQMVEVRGLAGEPMRCAVARWWDGAPGINPFPPDCIATRWRDKADIGWTDELSGVVGFGMGKGDMPGSSAVFPIHCLAPADYVGKLGWLPYTNHRSIVVTFQMFSTDEPIPPAPADESMQKVIWRLGRIATATEAIAAKLAAVT